MLKCKEIRTIYIDWWEMQAGRHTCIPCTTNKLTYYLFLINALLMPFNIFRECHQCDDSSKNIVSENWLQKVRRELGKEGISLPERWCLVHLHVVASFHFSTFACFNFCWKQSASTERKYIVNWCENSWCNKNNFFRLQTSWSASLFGNIVWKWSFLQIKAIPFFCVSQLHRSWHMFTFHAYSCV